MYFSRVAGIIQNSDISKSEFEAVVRQLPTAKHDPFLKFASVLTGPVIDIRNIHSMNRFKKKWGVFVTLCMTEWANLNIVSALLLG